MEINIIHTRRRLASLTLALPMAICLCFSCRPDSVPQQGVTYYLDADGGDNRNTGTSPQQPWKSLEQIQNISLQAGDSVLLKRNSIFPGILELTGRGEAHRRIIVDAYGEGKKPCVVAPDSSLYAIRICNADYLTLQNLEVINTGSEPLPFRTGVKVLCQDYGVSRHIILNALDIHDVNGSRVKRLGGGSAILIENRWKETVSVFDSLTIEHCTIRRCERNAMIWSAQWSRQNWQPNTHTVVRYNLIEEVPGDGIVPIGCDGTLIEYNRMHNCPPALPDTEAAAGIWPWSCDNTVIQFNEVSHHKAPWDAQGFDSDYNCRNTVIQYNYSHDNEGGFLLICNAGGTDTTRNIGNIASVVRYNISINDAIRTRPTREGTFSPTIHIAGNCTNKVVANNILHINRKPEGEVDRSIITSNSWNGYADNTLFEGNIFYAAQPSAFRMTQSTRNTFTGNYYLGTFTDRPADKEGKTQSTAYNKITSTDPEGFNSLGKLMKTYTIANGTARMTTIDKDAITSFFQSGL